MKIATKKARRAKAPAVVKLAAAPAGEPWWFEGGKYAPRTAIVAGTPEGLVKGLRTFPRAVLYDGPSLHDGKRILVIATGIALPSTRAPKGSSGNSKTGRMIQIWIIRHGVHPSLALENGMDESVCGTCIHRPIQDEQGRSVRTCYVRTDAVASTAKAVHAGRFVDITANPGLLADLARLTGQKVRWGAYGDPGMIPFPVVEPFLGIPGSGYTHRAHEASTDPRLSLLCMASCDSRSARARAKEEGWRTFRVALSLDREAGEFTCPASHEAGQKVTCEACGACNGSTGPQDPRKDRVILLHAVGLKKARRMAALRGLDVEDMR